MGHKIRKALFVILIVIIILIFASTALFFIMRTGGEKAMKKNISNAELSMKTMEGEETPEDSQDDLIWYQGKAYQYNEDMVTVLGMGMDEAGEDRRVDIIFLIALDTANDKTRIIAVPGETITSYSAKTKEMVDVVSELFYGIPVHGYMALNTEAVAKMNDVMGGIEVTVPEDLSQQDSLLKKGKKVTLEGESAYTFIHWLDSDNENGSAARLNRQRIYLQGFFARLKPAMKSNASLPLALYRSVSGDLETDLSAKKVVYLLTELAQTSLEMETLQGETNVKEHKYQIDENALYELILRTFYTEVE